MKPSQLDICRKIESVIRRNGIPTHVMAMSPFDHRKARLPYPEFISALGKYVRDYHGHSSLIVSVPQTTRIESRRPLTRLQKRMRHMMSDPKWQRPEPKLVFSKRKNVLTIRLGHFITHDMVGVHEPTKVKADWDTQVRTVRAAIRNARQSGAGIVLDLRNHDGGNFHPVVRMFRDLLKNTTVFAWCNEPPSSASRQWLTLGTSTHPKWKPSQSSYVGCLTQGRFVSGEFSYPCSVAVLIGHGTASSGEISAAMFVGKTGVRLFGDRSAGALTVNGGTAIAPGLELNLTQLLVVTTDSVMHFDERLTPDVITKNPLRDAHAWLAKNSQPPK